MKNLNDTLPELMRRATENLEPESSDLVERGMQRGAVLRRRRTALIGLSSATAVLATAGIIVSGTQLFANDAQPPAAGTTTTQSADEATEGKPVTQKETLATLEKLVPPRFKVTKAETWGGPWGNGAAVLIDDGAGVSRLQVAISAPGTNENCYQPQKGTCVPRPDGSRITALKDQPTYTKDNNPGGILHNSVDVVRPGTEAVGLMSFNATQEKQVEHTRAKPALTLAELTAMADSQLWRFPPKPPVTNPSAGPGKPSLKDPGAGKPAVPVQQTLQTLRKLLPKNLQVSTPGTWGGGTDGHNGASYVVDDGKGLSQVLAFVTHETPVTKCTAERSTSFCQVRADGSVIGWTKNAPEYSDARQAKEGVLGTTVEIHYPDGRFINLTSYNAVAEKGSKHTRAKPALSAEQLLAMAGNKDWKFPGTKK